LQQNINQKKIYRILHPSGRMPNSKCSKVDGAEEIFVNNHALGNVLEEAKRLEFDCIVMASHQTAANDFFRC